LASATTSGEKSKTEKFIRWGVRFLGFPEEIFFAYALLVNQVSNRHPRPSLKNDCKIIDLDRHSLRRLATAFRPHRLPTEKPGSVNSLLVKLQALASLQSVGKGEKWPPVFLAGGLSLGQVFLLMCFSSVLPSEGLGRFLEGSFLFHLLDSSRIAWRQQPQA
jgi:hypothetical protein